ncbi:hypothetical protein AALP_AAs48356U000600 [Arabis alpina]|uniref:Uncharacterized protein n=1 Tax=Arabis alpina TaxID=50452 RepID=A0A087G152_ARAAL|nr:hypothetical protein AALP_AAs48356U000600 [Arabis alpina]
MAGILNEVFDKDSSRQMTRWDGSCSSQLGDYNLRD